MPPWRIQAFAPLSDEQSVQDFERLRPGGSAPDSPICMSNATVAVSARLQSTKSARQSCRAQSSRTPLIDQILDLQTAKGDTVARFEQAGNRSASTFPIKARPGRYQLGDRLAAPRDDDLLPTLHPIK